MRTRLAALPLCALALLVAPGSAQAFDFLPGDAGFDADVFTEGIEAPATQAGSHPVAMRIRVGFEQDGPFTDGDLRNLDVELPPGLIENPTAVPLCSPATFETPRVTPFEADRKSVV